MKTAIASQKKILLFPEGDERFQAYALVLKTPAHIVMIEESVDSFLKRNQKDFADLVLYNPFASHQRLDLIARIKQSNPKSKVLVISDTYDEELIIRTFREGASGFLLFSMHLHDFLKSVRDLFEGGAPMSREVAACLVSSYQTTPENPLTKREQDVLRELSTGKTYPYIAEALHLSVHTVRTHIQNIFDKLNVRNKSEALVLARMLKLI